MDPVSFWGSAADAFTATPAPISTTTTAAPTTAPPASTAIPESIDVRSLPLIAPAGPSRGPNAWTDLFDVANANALATSKDIITAQEATLAAAQAAKAASASAKTVEYDGPTPTGKGLLDLAMAFGAPPSMSALLEDVQDAVLGVVNDLTGGTKERQSVQDIVLHNNRLRGIGAILVLVALVGIIVDSLGSGASTASSVATAALGAVL